MKFTLLHFLLFRFNSMNYNYLLKIYQNNYFEKKTYILALQTLIG